MIRHFEKISSTASNTNDKSSNTCKNASDSGLYCTLLAKTANGNQPSCPVLTLRPKAQRSRLISEMVRISPVSTPNSDGLVEAWGRVAVLV